MSLTSQLSMLRAFRTTYEVGNFTRAAKVLGVTAQSASRAVGRLEDELGVVLFRRNTRHVEVTEAGKAYYEACCKALDTLAAAEARLTQTTEVPTGLVRVSVPTPYGYCRFLPMLKDFYSTHPGVEVDVECSNHNVDFVRDRFDFAIRAGDLGDASFVARRLRDTSKGIFGSPEYLDEHGVPRAVSDLDQHVAGLYVMPSTGRPKLWTLSNPEETIAPRSILKLRGDVSGLVAFAVAGGGLIQMYHFAVEKELESGDLVEVLPSRQHDGCPLSVIYPKGTGLRPAVRALVDFVIGWERVQRAA